MTQDIYPMDNNPNVTDTSKEAYRSIRGELSERQLQVLMAMMALKSANNEQVANFLQLKINQITGRMFELRQKGYLTFDYKGVPPNSNKSTLFWKVTRKVKEYAK